MAIFAIAFTLLVSCPTSIISLNSALDFSEPSEVICEVVNKPTSINKNNNTTYQVTIKYDDKTIVLNINQEKYNEISIGDLLVAEF